MEKQKKFEEAMKTATEWFDKNCNPHQTIIITMGGCELVNGDMAFSRKVPD